jgi:indoleamine 2,3-dioxygenase
VNLREFALRLQKQAGDDAEDDEEALWESRRLWLQLLDQVREFRWRHWCFGKEYILKMTDHPTATGGSPIVTWLPNQLKAVLNDMVNIAATVGEERLGGEVQAIMDLVRRQEETLRKEVEKYCEERGVARS